MLFTLSCDENPGDTGTTAGGIIERDLNIKVATALATALERCGQHVHADFTITYQERVTRANTDGTDVLVACAHNAVDNPEARGTVFVFCSGTAHQFGKQQEAAQNIGGALVRAGLFPSWTTYDEAVVECCEFNKDTVYIEYGYQTNPQDRLMLLRPDYPHLAAEATCQGLAKTYGFVYVTPLSAGSNVLNKKLWLTAPDFNQLATGDVVNYNDCGETCLAMYEGAATKMHRVHTVQQIRAMLKNTVGITSGWDLVRGAHDLGLEAHVQPVNFTTAIQEMVRAYKARMLSIPLGRWVDPTVNHWILVRYADPVWAGYNDPYGGKEVVRRWSDMWDHYSGQYVHCDTVIPH